MSFLDAPTALIPDPAPARQGRIALVGAGPGAADLMTLRAVRALEQADVVFYDRLVDPQTLAYARATAERVFVGKEVGLHSWPQDRINAAITAAALAGKRVVRLKSGDPSIFGRAAEEIAAARAFGIPVEVIPGVTAASAAAASLCQPLTERGQTNRVVLATATDCMGGLPTRIADIAQPGTTLVFYMAMHKLGALADQLLLAGVAPGQPVTVAANVAQQGERHLTTTLARLEADCHRAALRNPAIVMIMLAASGSTQTTATAAVLPLGAI